MSSAGTPQRYVMAVRCNHHCVIRDQTELFVQVWRYLHNTSMKKGKDIELKKEKMNCKKGIHGNGGTQWYERIFM
jgi:hypothetical protein